jgi:hypothetical protein
MMNRRQAFMAAAALPLNSAMRAYAAPQEQLKRTSLMTQALPALDGRNLEVTVQ